MRMTPVPALFVSEEQFVNRADLPSNYMPFRMAREGKFQKPLFEAIEDIPYQQLFDAIAAATSAQNGGAVNISVEKFRAALSKKRIERVTVIHHEDGRITIRGRRANKA